ncbi:hypothetical protein [Undibacterium flavidum]|uniref:Uncharacterized protein n=1 Tax=Undibacterium flavidum TaxID=2762297 RepID=A0ABR6YBK2_9BURK|nr:hypothetical protein [Undibacterium flavidum]MBC3874023.1 hypothetical protein [Undibacterium flavidum]
MAFRHTLQHSSRQRISNIVCLFLLLTAIEHLLAQGRGKSVYSEYGRRIELKLQLSTEDLARLAAFRQPAENLQALGPSQVLNVTTENWIGEKLNASKDGGPYTVVVTIAGKAKANGDAVTLWNSG